MSLIRCAGAVFLMSVIFAAFPGPLFAAVSVDEEEVLFTLTMSGAQKIFVTGDFNGWNPTLDRMAQEGENFELRLYLIPGKYRYMFVVDGETIADPDNPWKDEEGRTFFVFRQKDDGYEIVFSGGIEPSKGTEIAEAALDIRGYARAGEEGSELFVEPEISGLVGGRIRARLSPGFEYDPAIADRVDSYLLRADASYRGERGGIHAFNRSGDLDFGDPLKIFGNAGPFGYGAGIFSRGVTIDGEILFGVRGRAFFSDRMNGYKSGFETCGQSCSECVSAECPFYDADPVDADTGGLMASFSCRRLSLDYYYRRDSGPGGKKWPRPGEAGWIYTGYRAKYVHGGTIRIGGPWNTVLEAECLDGRTMLSSTGKYSPAAGEVPFEYDQDWESGRRILAGIKGSHGNVSSAISWNRTTMEGDPLLRMGRSRDVRTAGEISIGYQAGLLQALFRGSVDRFNKEGSAIIFWLQRYNFWLDGDDIDVSKLPFLHSRGVYLLSFILEEKNERVSGPYPMAGKFLISLRSDMFEKNRRMLQIGLARGFELFGNVSFHFDIRHVSYCDGKLPDNKGFMDVWTGLCGKIGDSAWISMGAGVSPYTFDRWLYRVTEYGREKYLFERIIPRIDETGKIEQVTNTIKHYEKELSEQWTVSFEAGILF